MGSKQVLSEKPDVFDPKVYSKAGREKVKELVKNRMQVCGCQGRYKKYLSFPANQLECLF